MSIVSIVFIVYQNHVVFSSPGILQQRKDFELDEYYEYDSEYSIRNITNIHDDGCDSDDNYGDVSRPGWEGRIEQKIDYLKHHRNCILKYCGEVCNTRYDSEKGTGFQTWCAISLYDEIYMNQNEFPQCGSYVR